MVFRLFKTSCMKIELNWMQAKRLHRKNQISPSTKNVHTFMTLPNYILQHCIIEWEREIENDNTRVQEKNELEIRSSSLIQSHFEYYVKRNWLIWNSFNDILIWLRFECVDAKSNRFRGHSVRKNLKSHIPSVKQKFTLLTTFQMVQLLFESLCMAFGNGLNWRVFFLCCVFFSLSLSDIMSVILSINLSYTTRSLLKEHSNLCRMMRN